jgi:hypothetical protein
MKTKQLRALYGTCGICLHPCRCVLERRLCGSGVLPKPRR